MAAVHSCEGVSDDDVAQRQPSSLIAALVVGRLTAVLVDRAQARVDRLGGVGSLDDCLGGGPLVTRNCHGIGIRPRGPRIDEAGFGKLALP